MFVVVMPILAEYWHITGFVLIVSKGQPVFVVNVPSVGGIQADYGR